MTEGIMAESIRETPRSKYPAEYLPLGATNAGTTKKTSASNQASVGPNFEFFTPEGRDDLDAFLQANEAIINGIAALNLEMMDFGKRRLNEYRERAESLMRCKDAEEANCIERDFAQTATLQYLEHSYNVLATVINMTEGFLSPLHETVTKTFEGLTKEIGPVEKT